MSATGFAISPSLNPDALAARFAADRRLQIHGFLVEDGAQALRNELLASPHWQHVLNSGAKVFEASRTGFEAMPYDQREALDAAVMESAARGFQFRYDLIRVPDSAAQRRQRPDLLAQFVDLMNDPATLAWLSAVSGVTEIRFADAQATFYRPGDFLTRHDDNSSAGDRRLAYVLGLTPGWQVEWGGLLLFNDADGAVAHTIVPRFNSLALFEVPRPHSVSYVAPFAPEPRLSVTGWLRSCAPPA